jgi:hypothetical protein
MAKRMTAVNEVNEAEAAAELLASVTPERYPGLVAALHGSDGARLGAELAQLLRGRWKERAPRRAVTRLARLQFLKEDEVVLLKDISTSGVRLLMERHPDVDLANTPGIVLCVNTDTRCVILRVEFVRVCGTQGQHVDLGFRFLEPGPHNEDVVRNLRNFMFVPR